nr:retrovirus-related Pol polyprotein from transposon TNT 1-94 [Tanacetum cinerariifolium]
TVEDKIFVPKPPKNCAQCTRCGYLVDGPNCQGCALLRKELEENLVAHSLDFQNTSEPSNARGAVSWQSRLQKCVALSTTGAEYVAATEACKELLWLKRFLQELGFKQQRYAVLCDNQSAIHLAKNSMFHKRTKYIDVRSHKPIRRAISDAVEYHHQQPPHKTRTPPPCVSSSHMSTHESSVGKRSPQLEASLKKLLKFVRFLAFCIKLYKFYFMQKMNKLEDMVKEIEQRYLDIISQDEDDIPDPPKPKEQEECVGVEP